MDSKISLKIIFVIFSIFVGHICIYFFVPSYAEYFKNIKHYGNENTEVGENSLDNNGQNKNRKTAFSSYTGSNYIMPDINEDIKDSKVEKNTATEYESDSNEDNNSEEGDNIIDDNDAIIQVIFDLFSDYDLQEKEETQNSSLFGLTNEYPYDYKEYYSREKKMTLYVFKEKDYTEILNIFDVISYNLYFKIKKVNNFGDKSFYINLDSDLDDNYVRFVFSYKNSNFGLKIKKDGYNEVKDILKTVSKEKK
ncbi:hypothetical protein EOM39_01475 [Candidatus Gracilibacteria bacterium]|nr:hypothetical protein [Candidatus Gracilibacteria bacterium]